jgi:hypothetical protein
VPVLAAALIVVLAALLVRTRRRLHRECESAAYWRDRAFRAEGAGKESHLVDERRELIWEQALDGDPVAREHLAAALRRELEAPAAELA